MKMRRHNNIRIYFDIMIFKMLRQKPYEIVLLSFLLKNRLFINSSRYHMIYVSSAFSASSTWHRFTPSLRSGTGQNSIWDTLLLNRGRSEINFYYVPERSYHSNFFSKYAFRSSILILSCSMVSRSRTVTAPSSSDSKSYVTQKGVPISS